MDWFIGGRDSEVNPGNCCSIFVVKEKKQMRKSIKRALSVALAVAVIFGESAIANAAETVIDVQDGADYSHWRE